MLHKLTLFKDVKITPDYSVVHDLTPSDWKDYLVGTPLNPTPNGDIVWEGMVNYYRLPDVIRIEGNYDTLRKVTYGMVDCARGTDETQLIINESMERPMFFFVKNVRLVKQESRVDKDEASNPMVWDIQDVVELEIEVDVWSSNNGSFELYDSFVERKHMDRWVNKGTELVPNWQPIYYPNAGQGVDGAYKPEDIEIITPYCTFQNTGNTYVDTHDFLPKFIILTAIKANGTSIVAIGLELWGVPLNDSENSSIYDVYPGSQHNWKMFGSSEILGGGSLFTDLGITAENVQSICVVPFLGEMHTLLAYAEDSGDQFFDLDTTNLFDDYGLAMRHGTTFSWFEPQSLIGNIGRTLKKTTHTVSSAYAPQHITVLDGLDHESMEPMLFREPCRSRKVVSAMGGEIFTIPDIKAFDKDISMQILLDFAGAEMMIYGGTDLLEANTLGSVGVQVAMTLPIYNSAWKSYEAINKIGDEIAYNAKQMQTFANGAAGTASNAIIGGAIGGVLGGAANIITGIVGTGTAMYGNAEELRAKQVTIRNSPCTVKSSGSGLTAYVLNYTGLYYVVLCIDDVSYEKLKAQYYWYGYMVNRVFRGTVNTKSRILFDFIKTGGAKIRGDLNAGAAKQIADIFDRGVTIYHGTAGYGKIGSSTLYDNEEV